MNADRAWTIDSIWYAIPAPEVRQTFLKQVNLTPLPELPAVLGRWAKTAGELGAARPKIEALRDWIKTHGAEPDELLTHGLDHWYDTWTTQQKDGN